MKSDTTKPCPKCGDILKVSNLSLDSKRPIECTNCGEVFNVPQTTKFDGNECLRRLNLERPDIAALQDGGLVTCNVTDLRYIRDYIVNIMNLLDGNYV